MACNQTISGILRDCTPNMGGIKRALIANADDVTAMTVTADQVNAITMASGAVFVEFNFRKGSSHFTSTLNKDDANGVSYVSTEIVLNFNRMETTKRVEMAALAVNEMCVLIQDSNDKWWAFGVDEPVLASAGTGESGTARTDRNGYSITLLDNAKSWPYEATDEAVADALGS